MYNAWQFWEYKSLYTPWVRPWTQRTASSVSTLSLFIYLITAMPTFWPTSMWPTRSSQQLLSSCCTSNSTNWHWVKTRLAFLIFILCRLRIALRKGLGLEKIDLGLLLALRKQKVLGVELGYRNCCVDFSSLIFTSLVFLFARLRLL